MTDNTANAGAGAAHNNTNNATGATDANKNTGTGGGENGIDTSKFTDADWDKIYKDPNLYNNPRFKGLNDQAKKAREYEAQQVEAEKARLTEQKKFQELADLNKKEAETWKSKAETATVDNSIVIEAQKLGVVDVEVVKKLLDRSGIKLGEDGNVSGVEEAVKSLVDSKPYLKGNGNRNLNIGGKTNPTNNNTTVTRFKASQLRDRDFFKTHEKEIGIAMATGNIENDVNLGR